MKQLGNTLLALGAAAALMLEATGAGAQPTYQLDSVVGFKGKAPSWDYITFEPARGYLFMGRRAEGVTVYDTRTKTLVAQLADTKGSNGVALVPEFDRGYTAAGDGTTTVFQLSTLKTLEHKKLGESADAAYYDPASKQVVFTRGDDHLLTFVDARTGKTKGELKLDADELEGVAPDGRGAIYVIERDKAMIAKVDAATRTLKAQWPIAGCELPTGLAMDQAAGRLLIGCKGEHPVLAVMDVTTGKVTTRAEIGRGNDGVVYDPEGKRVFTSNGVDGNLVIFDQLGPDSYRLAQAVTTRPIARTMAFDPATKTIYTMAAEGMVDPAKPVNKRAGAFYPNTYFDDTFKLLIFTAHDTPATVASTRP